MSIEVKGLGALQAQLNELRVELAVKALAQAARKAFAPVLEAARALVPRDTGALADSLQLSVVKPKSGDAVVVVGIRIGKGRSSQARAAAAAFGEGQLKGAPPARRWHFIELGTSKYPAHPFLRPALDRNKGVVLDALKKELQASIKRALKRKGGK